MIEETNEERQDNEFEALQSIFGDDVADNRPPIAWKVWRPIDLTLSLFPLHSSTADGSHCSLTLHIKCCPNYPNKPPELSVVKLRGISNDNGMKLLDELNELAQSLIGEVMIFNLANHVQNFLHLHNRPATKSFYDEMVQRNNEMEQLKIKDQELKENEERQAMNMEIEKRQAMLRGSSNDDTIERTDDKEDNAQLLYYSGTKNTSPSSKRRLRKCSEEVKCSCVTRGIQVVRVVHKGTKKVHLGKCIGHSLTGAVTFAGIDAETGELIVIRKWTLPAPKDLQARNRQMNAIDQDISQLSRIRHVNVVPYISMEVQHDTFERSRTHSTTVFLLRDFVRGTTLSDLRASLNSLMTNLEPLSFVRVLAKGLFGALTELHSAGLLHGDIRPENVFVNFDGTVKLVGASLDVRLTDMFEGDNYSNTCSKEQDIFLTAQLLLSFLTEGNIMNQEIPSHLPSTAKHFFSRCLTDEEGQQWSAADLLDHDFLKGPSDNQTQNHQKNIQDVDDIPNSLVSSVLSSNGASRLEAEFEILKWLGRGAFGDVIKVRNKLDDGLYAIKRIALNPERVQMNRTITREVTLLSRLNHENVVRYYNAWIETAHINGEESPDTSERDTTATDVTHDKPQVATRTKQSELSACVARLAPGGVTLDWSISDLQRDNQTQQDEDNEEDDDEWFKFALEPPSSSDEDSFVQFEMSDDCTPPSQSDSNVTRLSCSEKEQAERTPQIKLQQTLYIQMEFCERNTLRQAIDNGLYLEKIRAWRLFREIVEGLAHVHQRGMIHRDLKPMNIFIDSNDHVKIGDFGLATKVLTGLHFPTDEKSRTTEEVAGSMTGQIGTALYVAPELLQAANKVIYNQKVDIYSLGIILFEMFHPPLNTGMERMKVLNALRSKEIIMPKSFITEENSKQIEVIRWLVSHDASTRPTCSEILSSALIPRALAADTLAGLLEHALANRHSKPHARLISACMEQTFTLPEDLTYDSGVKSKNDCILSAVKDVVIGVFRGHGAVEFSPPLLMPKIEKSRPFGARLMTASGGVVHLPHDLRYPFARHVAYSEVRSLRRYCVDKVFREKKAAGFHPRELAACAFDICAPITTAGIWIDAELISVVHAITKKLGLQVSYQISHRDILDSILESSGVPKDKYSDIYPVLAELATGRIGKMQLQTHLSSMCLAPKDTAAFLRLMEARAPIQQAASLLGGVRSARRLLNAALKQLTDLDAALKNLGVECELLVVPCLAANAAQHDGVFWHARAFNVERASKATDLLAVGGRYGALLDEFFEISKGKSHQRKVTCVGLTINLERIANLMRREKLNPSSDDRYRLLETVKVAVCFRPEDKICGNTPAITLTRALWAVDVPTVILETLNCEEARELSNAGITLVPHDTQSSSVALTHWDEKSGSVTERRLNVSDAVATVLDIIRRCSGSEAKITDAQPPQLQVTRTSSESVNINFLFVTDEREKVSGATRRRLETQAYNKLSVWCSRSGIRGRVSCVCVSLPLAPLAALASRPHAEVLQQYSRDRRLLSEVIDAISGNTMSRGDEPTLQCLYSLEDWHFAVVT